MKRQVVIDFFNWLHFKFKLLFTPFQRVQLLRIHVKSHIESDYIQSHVFYFFEKQLLSFSRT